jgi:hypothetical protein
MSPKNYETVPSTETSAENNPPDEFGRRDVLRRILVAWIFGATRQAISYMAADMHSNIQNALMVPVRLWSYKVKRET